MPDLIPAPRIAAVALSRVQQAEEAMNSVASSVPAYSRDEFKAAISALTVARELLTLIADRPDAKPAEDARSALFKAFPVAVEEPAPEAFPEAVPHHQV